MDFCSPSRFRRAALWGVGGVMALGLLPRASGSLIINEIFQSNQSSREWVEFLVTSDITLGALDSFWFGNTTADTNAIQTMSRFDSTEIINSFSYFTSTSDIIKAGSLIVVGGTDVAPDFTYNPSSLDPFSTSLWNFSLVGGNGISGNTNSLRPRPQLGRGVGLVGPADEHIGRLELRLGGGLSQPQHPPTAAASSAITSRISF